MNKKTVLIAQAAVIAAIYVILVFIFQLTSFGPVQFRIAEALTVLPYFTSAAIPGVTIGCLLSNLLFGAETLDIIFGTMATLIAAILSYRLRFNRFLVPIPPILVNALVLPWIFLYAYTNMTSDPIPLLMLSFGGGQLISAGVLGMVLLFAMERVKHILFKND